MGTDGVKEASWEAPATIHTRKDGQQHGGGEKTSNLNVFLKVNNMDFLIC